MLGALFVIAVTTGISYVLSDDPAERSEVTNVGNTRTDHFDRPRSDNGLGTGGLGTWQSVRGVWGIQLGTAFLPFPDPDRSLAIVDVGASAVRVQTTVYGRQVCGIVARYDGPDRYIALIRVPEFAVWNLVERRDGDDRVLAKLPDIDEDSVGIALAVDDGMVQAEVGLKRAVVAGPVAPRGTSIGLLGQASTATECSWDDVTVQMMK